MDQESASPQPSAELAKGTPRRLFRGVAQRAMPQRDCLERAVAPRAHVSARTLDHGLAAAGVAAAIGSAAFAGYMLTHVNSHPTFGGAEHLRLFAQPLDSRRRREAVAESGDGAAPLDYNATGSIRRAGAPNADVVESKSETDVVYADGKSRAGRETVLGGYVVRFVHKGYAIVQGRKGSYAVAPGVNLPNVGRVLSVQKRESGWVVLTANGVITERGL